MVTDLHTRLRSAIEEQLALAQAASGTRHGNTPTGEHWHWECSTDDTPIPITDVVLMDEFLECPRCGSVGVDLRSDEQYQTDSVGTLPHLVTNSAEEISPIVGAHLAANDPAFVIRACRADLQRLERHAPVEKSWVPKVDDRSAWLCDGHDLSMPPWPCSEVRSLAEVWEVAL